MMQHAPFRLASRLVALAAALVLLVGAAVPAGAAAVKIVVNDSAITDYDIAQRARLLVISQRLSEGAARQAAIEELIVDALRMQAAKRSGVSVPNAEVDEAVAGIASRMKLSPSQFSQALGQAGVDIGVFKQRIRAQMTWGRIVRAQLQRKVRTEKTDIIAQLHADKKDGPTAEDYILQRVIFTLKKGAPAATVARRKQEAEQLRARFTSCDTGLAAARAIPEVAVLNVGRRLAGELPGPVAELVKDTPVGRLTAPQVGESGIELFAVCGKQASVGGGDAASGYDAEALNSQGKEISDDLTRRLRQQANIVYR